jgi:crossover junction endodeoxyribonuclease RuvC
LRKREASYGGREKRSTPVVSKSEAMLGHLRSIRDQRRHLRQPQVLEGLRRSLYTASMRVLGIDCGTEYTGYGVVELCLNGELTYLTCGAVKLSPRESMPRRLSTIFDRLGELIREHQPDNVAIEEVFYSVNAKSALKLGQVRGVAMLAASAMGLEVAEYSPLSIKSAVVGYGRAEKEQVQHMVMQLLKLAAPPQPADAADALAIAICHLHTSATLARQGAVAR